MAQFTKGHQSKKLAAMGQRRGYFTLSGRDSQLYAVGGRNFDGSLVLVQSYLIASNNWKRYPSLNIARQKAGVCCHPSQGIYIFGGFCSKPLSSIDLKENDQNQFKIIDIYSPYPFYCVATRLINDDILIFGGFKDSDNQKQFRIMTLFKVKEKQFEDKGYSGLVPLNMTCRPYLTHNEEIFVAVHQSTRNDDVFQYDGFLWYPLKS